MGSSDIIIDTISTLYSGITESSNESLVCSQGNATNSITKIVQNSSGNFRDVLYSAYADIPLYKYDDTGCLYILKSVQHYMKGSVSCNWPTMDNAAGFLHNVSLLDRNGTELGVVRNQVGNTGNTGTAFNYTDAVSLSAFDYAITTQIIRIKVTTAIKFDMVSGNSGVVSQTGNAQNNEYLTVTYLKQP